MDWKKKAKDANPIVLEHMQRLVEKNRSASPEVTTALVGMILRGDEAKSGASRVTVTTIKAENDHGGKFMADGAPSESDDDENEGGDDDAEDDLAPCDACEGSGQVTLDEFATPLPRLLAEIERDKQDSPNSQSRTEVAINSGALKITKCDACNGKGLVPA